jgi:membrane protein DedA with SNARE-associated domain
VQEVLDWLASLPLVALYAMMFVAAAVENIFPPIPADTVVAFGSFLAARGNGTVVGAFLVTLLGNMSGAAMMYAAGRRYGAGIIGKKLMKDHGANAEARLRAMYERFGLFALFLSRFVPGVRAIVPPFAGALKLPPVRSLLAMGLASGLWYGFVAVLAFRVGDDFEALQRTIGNSGKIVGAVALGLVTIGAIIWLIQRRRAKT